MMSDNCVTSAITGNVPSKNTIRKESPRNLLDMTHEYVYNCTTNEEDHDDLDSVETNNASTADSDSMSANQGCFTSNNNCAEKKSTSMLGFDAYGNLKMMEEDPILPDEEPPDPYHTNKPDHEMKDNPNFYDVMSPSDSISTIKKAQKMVCTKIFDHSKYI